MAESAPVAHDTEEGTGVDWLRSCGAGGGPVDPQEPLPFGTAPGPVCTKQRELSCLVELATPLYVLFSSPKLSMPVSVQ